MPAWLRLFGIAVSIGVAWGVIWLAFATPPIVSVLIVALCLGGLLGVVVGEVRARRRGLR